MREIIQCFAEHYSVRSTLKNVTIYLIIKIYIINIFIIDSGVFHDLFEGKVNLFPFCLSPNQFFLIHELLKYN